jgi:hypothetical protein
VTAALVVTGALMALPLLLLVAFALGPLALVPVLIVACVAPPLLLVGAIWLYAGKR